MPRVRWLRRLAPAALLVLLAAGPAAAHPLSQGTLDLTLVDGGVDVRARVTVEEASVTDLLVAQSAPGGGPAAMYDRHASYLAAHVHVAADGVALAPRVVRVDAPATAGGTSTAAADGGHAVYAIEYRSAVPGASAPA